MYCWPLGAYGGMAWVELLLVAGLMTSPERLVGGVSRLPTLAMLLLLLLLLLL